MYQFLGAIAFLLLPLGICALVDTLIPETTQHPTTPSLTPQEVRAIRATSPSLRHNKPSVHK